MSKCTPIVSCIRLLHGHMLIPGRRRGNIRWGPCWHSIGRTTVGWGENLDLGWIYQRRASKRLIIMWIHPSLVWFWLLCVILPWHSVQNVNILIFPLHTSSLCSNRKLADNCKLASTGTEYGHFRCLHRSGVQPPLLCIYFPAVTSLETTKGLGNLALLDLRGYFDPSTL